MGLANPSIILWYCDFELDTYSLVMLNNCILVFTLVENYNDYTIMLDILFV